MTDPVVTEPVVIQYPLALDGLVTRVLECGDGDDVLVCLHGAGSRADRWRPALPLLAAQGFHVYAVDFPGHGLAAKPEGYDYGSPAFTRGVHELIEQLGHGRVSLLGTSLGGHVSARVACERPETVRSAVLIGAVGLVPEEPSEDSSTGAPIADASPAGTRAKLESLVDDQSLITDEWVHEETMINTSPGSAGARAELGRYMAQDLDDDRVGEQYAALGLATMLCWGAQDKWIPTSVGDATAKLIPHAEYVLVDGAGHAPYFERPEAFVRFVLPFLEAHSRA
ncbi:alpha/beta fold hydrolase [soil metagenome]